MRKVAFLIAVFLVSSLYASIDIKNIEEAWEYVSIEGASDRWVVISHGDNYVQCENLSDVVRCPFPMWLKVIEGKGLYRAAEYSDKPFENQKGTKQNIFPAFRKEQKLKALFSKLNIEYFPAYSRLVNENNEAIGSGYDLMILFELNDTDAVKVIRAIFSEVWATEDMNSLTYETN